MMAYPCPFCGDGGNRGVDHENLEELSADQRRVVNAKRWGDLMTAENRMGIGK